MSVAGDVLLKPIVANAGKDISHWFNKDTKDVRESLLYFEICPKCTIDH